RWDVATGVGRTLGTHAGAIEQVAWSPDGTAVASAADDGTVGLWRLGAGRDERWRGDRDGVRTIAFSPDGTRLAAAGDDGTVRVWTLADGRMVEHVGHADVVHAVAFSPDGTLLASASRDQTVRLWGADGESRILRGHT